MWLTSSLLAMALMGPCDTPPAPAAPATPQADEDAEGDGQHGRFMFLWFLGPEGLYLDWIIEHGPREAPEAEAPPAVIFCAQVHIGVARWVGIAGDWTLERPLMVRLPSPGIGPTFWVGTTPTFWRMVQEAVHGADADE